MFQQRSTSRSSTHTQTQYTPGQNEDSINIQVVYTAISEEFMIITTKLF